ncbi:MAG: hypothetical protein DWQ34_19215 [Planctomycetota bacterium]|nr:MAG: hypothetical protein DWQ29_15630 [Planctomycetota bacterium]REJ89651.1 MAG: hypothetical protein DWQ34_19215 [Planctomycetota bacterium]REK24362.1 MAG: hypothetical protein DWQ41_15185 [Planctomycetota bacterium]REK38553.1 MAG: hypothetical protein DWQ45_03980 [Planctomycetota bacterium]
MQSIIARRLMDFGNAEANRTPTHFLFLRSKPNQLGNSASLRCDVLHSPWQELQVNPATDALPGIGVPLRSNNASSRSSGSTVTRPQRGQH